MTKIVLPTLLITMIFFLAPWQYPLRAQIAALDIDGDARIVGSLEVGENENTFLGFFAGTPTATGGNNTCVGFRTGWRLTTGTRNTLFGARTGQFIDEQEFNSYFGFSAGSQSKGINNSYFGAFSGTATGAGSNNTFIGYSAGRDTKEGDGNVSMGYQAGVNNIDGSNNTCLGTNAGLDNETGNNNVFVGFGAGGAELGSNKLYIHNSSSSAPLIYGDFENDELTIHGALGINKKQPTSELHVYHAATNGGGTTGLRLENSGANQNWWNFYTVNSSGNLLLFSKVAGNINVGSFNDDTGIYSSASDQRIKKNFEDLYKVLDKVITLKTKRYHFKSQSDQEVKTIGLIAQQVERVFPELVSYNRESDLYSLDYGTISVVAIKAIQEQSVIIDEQHAKLENVMEAYSKLENRLAKLEAQIQMGEN